MESTKTKFLENGYIKVENLLSPAEVDDLRGIYDELLKDKDKTAHLRSDLAGADNTPNTKTERITQIMKPSSLVPKLLNTSAYKKASQWAKELLGDDMDLDFDMMINKAPKTNTPTPWHQDAAYWINMPDQRSASCWIALDEVFKENGCMWFIPKREGEPILPHKNMPNGGALFCETDTSGAESIPLLPGGCTFHDGHTLHFSLGNSTENQRRALILNFRPQKMIDFEREHGVDHTGERKQRN